MTKQVNQQKDFISRLKMIFRMLADLGKWIKRQILLIAGFQEGDQDSKIKSAEGPASNAQKDQTKSSMQSVEYVKTVDVPLEVMWDFMKDFDNWAPMLKGYQNHKVINDRESIWEVKGEFGSFSRKTKFHTTITEWVQPSRVAFELKGLNEPVTGYGFISLSPSSNEKSGTIVSAEAGFTAGGVMGPLINRMVKPWMTTVAEELVEKVIAAVNPNDFKSAYWQN